MASKPMVPASGGGAMKKRKGLDPTTTGKNRPLMQKTAFQLAAVDDASLNDVRAGFLVARPSGVGTDTSIFGTGGARNAVSAESSGPKYAITASRGAQADTYSGTLANGRLFRSAMRTPGSEFVQGRRPM